MSSGLRYYYSTPPSVNIIGQPVEVFGAVDVQGLSVSGISIGEVIVGNPVEISGDVTIGNTLNTEISGTISTLPSGIDPNGSSSSYPASGVVNSNSSTTALLAGQSFTGGWAEASSWHGISIVMGGVGVGNQNAPGTFIIQNSNDGSNIMKNIPITVDSIASTPLRTLGVISKYYRFIYQNGDVDLSEFYIHTMYHTEQVQLISRLNQSITSSEDVTNVRAIVSGQTKSGLFRNVPTDSEGHLSVSIENPKTAFGDIRVSEKTTLIQSLFHYPIIHPQLYNVELSNGGTITPENSMLTFATGTNPNGSVVLSTKRSVKYMPGVGIEWISACIFGTPYANSTQFIGAGDASDGLFIGYNGTTFGILRRAGGSETFISQSNFNNDKLDGTRSTNNYSGMNLNPLKGNVYRIQYQWLGFGALRFFVESSETSDFVLFHTIHYANQNIIPTMQNPSQGLRWEVKNNGNVNNIEIKSGSGSCSIEGKVVKGGPPYFATTALAKSIESGEKGYFFSIKNKTVFHSKFNKISAFIRNMNFINDDNGSAIIYVYLNPTLTGASFTPIDSSYSVIDVDTSATIVANGILMAAFGVSKNSGVSESGDNFELPPGSTLTFFSNNTGLQTAIINWFEDI